MGISTLDYSKIFSRLCHLVVLTKENRTEQCIDNIILTLFVIDNSFAPSSISEVADALNIYFGLPINYSSIQRSFDRLLSQKKLLRIKPSNIYTIELSIKSKLENQIEVAYSLERCVRDQWFESIEKSLIGYSKYIEEQLWNCLRSYIGKAFNRHGAETIRLLSNASNIGEVEFKSLSTYLDEAVKECCQELQPDTAINYIRQFFQVSTSERTKYLAQLLDGTFTFYALVNDNLTADYLNRTISPLSLFLDTNFIFGVLDLHINPLVDISKEVLDVIQEYKLPFKLYYHEETLAEIRYTINSIGERLKARKWQQAVSRAVIHNVQISGIELRYHEKNSETPLDPAVFLSKYEGIAELLSERGFTIYRDTKRSEIYEKGQLIAEYKAFIQERRPDRPKPYEALNHDIVVWLTANSLRHKGSSVSSVLDAGALLLSVDYNFYNFDWERLRKEDSFGIVVLPNQFLQLLRPFITSTDDFDRRFVETFALPEFRVVNSDYSETCSKILSHINTFSDIKEETAVRILANSMLIEQLRGVDENSPEFENTIENFLAKNNEILIEENEALIAEQRNTEKQIKEKADLLNQTEDKLKHIEAERVFIEAERASFKDRLKEAEFLAEETAKALEKQKKENDAKLKEERNKQQQTEQEKNYYKHLAFVTRVAISITICVIGIVAILFLPYMLSWSWLANHPDRFGLYACSIIIWISLSYTITYWKNRVWSLGVMGAGTLFVLLQILHK